MTRVIVVSSGKGGVGKTTLVANLASALAEFNQNVVAVDCNMTTSNLGIHLGIPVYPKTLQHVLDGEARIKDAMYYHPNGFRVIPSDVSLSKNIVPRSHELFDVFYKLVGNTDFVLIDAAAGLGHESLASLDAADELLIVTNPELPALMDALKLKRMADKMATNSLGVVVNKVKGEDNEYHANDIENFLDAPIIGIIPDDIAVRDSIASKEPVVISKPNSKAALQMKALAAKLIGREFNAKPSMSHRLFGWLIK
jgi:septum site-determining protein MinD